MSDSSDRNLAHRGIPRTTGVDGNHDAEYRRRELDQAQARLRPDGLLVLDDVSSGRPGIQAAFREIPGEDGFRELGANGRIGVLART